MSTIKTPSIFMIILMLFVFLFSGSARAEVLTKEPEFSVPAGLYTEGFDLTITSQGTDDKIYYTFDGSIPVAGNTTTYEYTAPIRISDQAVRETSSRYFCGTVIRAVAVNPLGEQSEVASASYFVDSNIFTRYQLPIISIITDNKNLYDANEGIMSPFNTQNRGKEWERPIHFEYFDRDGKLQLSMGAGIRLHGAASRDWAFKSFRIYARTEYDEQDQFAYDFFGDSEIPAVVDSGDKKDKLITEFKRLILRNAGNEGTAGDGILFRDALTQALMVNTSLDLQAYAPAITFLNGEFYGIQNIRERQDEKYLEDHYDVDENEVVIYEFEYDESGTQVPLISNGEEADLEFYQEFVHFVREKDLSVKENFDRIKGWIDIENFVDYQIINLYGANRDWPGNNCKVWRVRTEYDPEAPYGLDGRLRYLVYDTDFCFGLYNGRAYYMDSLSDAMKIGGTEWPNQDGSTLLFRKLLENEEFKLYFCQRYLDLLNTNFDQDYVNTLIDLMAEDYKNAIDEFKNRFGLLHDWNMNINIVKEFVNKRENICKNFLTKKFNLGDQFFLTLQTGTKEAPIGGKILVNTVTIDAAANGVKNGTWRKSYFAGLPTMLTALPDKGYRFAGWSGASDSTDTTIDAALLVGQNSELTLTPIFTALAEGEEPPASTLPGEEKALEEAGKEAMAEAAPEADTKAPTSEENSIYLISILVLLLIMLLLVGYMILKRRKEIKNP